MKRHFYNSLVACLIFISIGVTKQGNAQDHSKAIAAADSSSFSPNKKDGWQLYNSFFNSISKDSAQIELILQHNGNIDWRLEQQVGKIRYKVLQPNKEQQILFKLLNESYALRIDDKGRCYLKFIKGIMPSNNPFIIPLQVNYKL